MNRQTQGLNHRLRWGVALFWAVGLLGSGWILTAWIANAAPPTPVLPSTSSSWQAQIERDLRRAEYRITWQEPPSSNDLPAAYQAPNRASNIRTYFTESGLSIIPRDLPSKLGMRASAESPATQGSLATDGIWKLLCGVSAMTGARPRWRSPNSKS